MRTTSAPGAPKLLPALLLGLLATLLVGLPPASAAACVGAAAMTEPDCPRTRTGPLTPAPGAAKKDKSGAYGARPDGDDCFANARRFPTRVCHFGDRRGDVTVALTGNSHAGAWLPAVAEAANRRGWHVVTYLASGCSPSDVAQDFDDATDACRSWVRRVTRRIVTDHPDVVLLVSKMSRRAVGHDIDDSRPAYRAGYRRVLQRWTSAGVRAVVLKDNPNLRRGDRLIDGPACLLANRDDYTACDAPRASSTPDDPAVQAARDVASPLIRPADLTDLLCLRAVCPSAIGGMTVYRDTGHLTRTFARTLAPYVGTVLQEALGRGGARPLTVATADFGGRHREGAPLAAAGVVALQDAPRRVRGDLTGTVRVHRGARALPVATRGLFVENVAGAARTVLRFDRDRRSWSVVNVDTTGARHPRAALDRVAAVVRRERGAGRTVVVTGAFGGSMERVARTVSELGLRWTSQGRAGIATPRAWKVQDVHVTRAGATGAPRPWIRLTLAR